MILLITGSERAQECATALQVASDQPTHSARTLYEALGLLRSNVYIAVVVDQCLLDADPEQNELIIRHLGTAIPVYVNCALCGIDRVVREVGAALSRREIEVSKARKAAEEALCSELREPLTAVLLNCDLLLEIPGLASSVREKITVIEEMAREVSNRLEREEAITRV
jgi:signal transduction histidine kinase